MKALFDQIREQGHSAIVRLWESKVQESLQLEFKQKANGSYGRLDPADYDNLGKTLSAFANSAGGLLIWGVRTEKHGKGKPDAADRGVPIAELAAFHSEIGRAVGEALMPRHEGIEILCVEDPARSNCGYVAIWVERSDRRPHRAERAAAKYYYKRIGNSTFAMEHYDIEDAFNRSAPPDLELILSSTSDVALEQRSLEKRFRIIMEFCLRNHSVTSGCAPYVWIDKIEGGNLTQVGTPHLKYLSVGGRILFAGDVSTFVHPGLDVPAFRVKFEATYHQGSLKWFFNDDPIERALLRLSVGIGCQDARARMRTIEYASPDLRSIITKLWPR